MAFLMNGSEFITIQPGEVLTNEQLCKAFGCSSSGRIRKTTHADSLVLISDHTSSISDDYWKNETLLFTGMGAKGNQTLEESLNAALFDSAAENPRNLYLLEIVDPDKSIYRYLGQAELTVHPYTTQRYDETNRLRDVWVFPIRLTRGLVQPVKADQHFEAIRERDEIAIKNLNDDILLAKINQLPSDCSSTDVSRTQRLRNGLVIEYARRRAKGICELCEKPGPFKDKEGRPFLEVHHIIWLANGGEDTIRNVAALCPNCHRRMHVLNLAADIEKLKELRIKAP